MSLPVTELQARLEQCFAGQYTQLTLATGQLTMGLPRPQLLAVCQRLRVAVRVLGAAWWPFRSQGERGLHAAACRVGRAFVAAGAATRGAGVAMRKGGDHLL